MREIIIGTRGSQLALTQTNLVAIEIKRYLPDVQIVIKQIKTIGDGLQTGNLAQGTIDQKGLFVKEIEDALLCNEIDLAVHSMKDVPTEIPEGLTIAAITKRLNPCDALISRSGETIDKLQQGALIGTSSLRRKTQLLCYRPDFQFYELRGNVDTRLKKLEGARDLGVKQLSENVSLDAVIVAAAGLTRMGMKERITQMLPIEIMMPSVGQGALGIEIRQDNPILQTIVDRLNDKDSFIAITAERAFLKGLGGGCQMPIAALATIVKDDTSTNRILHIEGLIASVDGKQVFKDRIEGKCEQAESLGKRLAENISQISIVYRLS